MEKIHQLSTDAARRLPFQSGHGRALFLPSKEGVPNDTQKCCGMQWEDALNLKMEVNLISRIIRHQIIPYSVDNTDHNEMLIETDDDNDMLKTIMTLWTSLQTNEESLNPITVRFKSTKLPTFSYAVLFVLVACTSNHSVCVLVDPDELCCNAFTIRSLLREVVDGCSMLSTLQFITIIQEIANQLYLHPM
jgi:hypothetical protein